MCHHSRVGYLLGRGIGSQEIKAVALGFGVDYILTGTPLQPPFLIHCVIEILVGLKPLQHPSHLTGQFLRTDFLTLHRRPSLEFAFRLGQAGLAPLPVPRLPPRSPGNHIPFTRFDYFHQPCAIPQFGRRIAG